MRSDHKKLAALIWGRLEERGLQTTWQKNYGVAINAIKSGPPFKVDHTHEKPDVDFFGELIEPPETDYEIAQMELEDMGLKFVTASSRPKNTDKKKVQLHLLDGVKVERYGCALKKVEELWVLMDRETAMRIIVLGYFPEKEVA